MEHYFYMLAHRVKYNNSRGACAVAIVILTTADITE